MFFLGLVPHFCDGAEETQLSSPQASQWTMLKQSKDGV